jgi:hypothetical protein
MKDARHAELSRVPPARLFGKVTTFHFSGPQEARARAGAPTDALAETRCARRQLRYKKRPMVAKIDIGLASIE